MSKGDVMRKLLRVALVFVLVCEAACRRGEARKEAPVADTQTQRQTTSGEVVGFQGPNGSDVWMGIPFAKAPIAELRWRAPQPPDAWTGVRPALAAASPCTQYAGTMAGGAEGKPGEPSGSEDCLYLNVWSPRAVEGTPPAGLPVMFWIHGGGNTVGHGGFYNGAYLATKQNVVVVSINYRLGPFGWFRHASLRQGADPLDASGNYGTLDIVRALQWVHDNIAVFGGNPGNVTIFGESAGGTDVFTMLLAPQARGLFHRAIVESGGLGFDTPDSAEKLKEEGGEANSSNELLLRLLVTDGKAKDREAAKKLVAGMSGEDIAVYLRGKSSYEILRGFDAGGGFGMIDVPRVFADGTVLPAGDPLDVFARGEYNAVPTMLGTNRDENKLFMFGDPEQVRRILWIVPRLRDERMYNLTAEYMAKEWKATGADMPAEAMRVRRPDVYVYRFDWDEEPTMLGADLGVMLGAAHFFEVPFVFGHFDIGPESHRLFNEGNAAGRQQLSDQMMSYWAQFAYEGTPGQGRKQELPSWESAPAYMVLDTPAGGGLRMSNETVTAQAVIAGVDTDPRLKTAEDRCKVLHSLARWSRGFTRADYAAREECKPFGWGWD